MGIFDSLFGKKKPEPPPAPATSATSAAAAAPGPAPGGWPAMLAAARRHDDFDWDWDNPRARRLVNEFLATAAPHFGNAKVKEIPDDENIDLRGKFEGSPVRFAVWMSFGSFWAIQMRAADPLAPFEIERDHEKIPKRKDDDDPWDEDEERRIFVAKGIFFEGYDHDINEKLDRWAKLPEALQERILVDMERLDCTTVRAHGNEIAVHQTPGLPELADPIAYMSDCAKLMASIRDQAPKASDAIASMPAAEVQGLTLGIRISCAFCSSLYLQTPNHNNCPNCGAPPQA